MTLTYLVCAVATSDTVQQTGHIHFVWMVMRQLWCIAQETCSMS